MIIMLILIEKDVENLVSKSLYSLCQNPVFFKKKVKKDQMAIKIARQTILKGINN